MGRITYQNKATLNENPDILDIYKVKALDMNEIKNIVNMNTPVGVINMFAGSTAPLGWLICDGSAVSRSTYSDLFSVIGTTYGEGDGSTTFNLPDLRGRIGVGKDSNDTDFDTLGETGGSKELQKHSHLLKMNGDNNVGGNAPFDDYHYIIQSPTMNVYTNGWVSETGTGESGNVQPYIVVNYIISY
jgi:microcystin-dependent protein